MSRTGRTLTRTIEIEPRQHDLFGMDLGEGPLRGQLVFGMLCFAVWLAITLPPSFLFGSGPSPNSALWFLAPPAALTVLGWRRTDENPRRRKVTQGLLALRYVISGHEPIVTMGRHVARSDAVRLRDRVAGRFGKGDLLALADPTRLHKAPTKQRQARPRGNPRVTFRPVARTYGTDYTARVVQQERRHKARPPRRHAKKEKAA